MIEVVKESARNSLAMSIVVFRVVRDDEETIGEFRKEYYANLFKDAVENSPKENPNG